MTKVHRLLAVCAFLGVAVFVSSSSQGQSGKKAGGSTTPQLTPTEKISRLADAPAESRFSLALRAGVNTYQPLKGDVYFAMSVKPSLDAAPPRSRDFLIMLSTSGTQASASRIAGYQIAEGIIETAREFDRVSVWTANEPKFTTNLTRNFLTPQDHAEGKRLREVMAKCRVKEIPVGTTDLKNALMAALKTFDSSKDRQRILLFLDDGVSTFAPMSPTDYRAIAKMMVERRVAFFPIPLGLNPNFNNLHDLADSTGGTVLRTPVKADKMTDTLKRYEAAFAVPILYAAKLRLPVGMTDVCPSVLPPLRSDSPTLVAGRMKDIPKQIDYTIIGNLDGKKAAVTIKVTEKVLVPNPENYFLVGLIEKWAKVKESTIVVRADRSLAFPFEPTRPIGDLAGGAMVGGIPPGMMGGGMPGMMGGGMGGMPGMMGGGIGAGMMMGGMPGMMGGDMPGTREKFAPATPPAIADPVVGREASVAKPKRNEPQSGILTAGSFDDNINPQVFNSYVKKMNQLRGLGNLPTQLQGQRLLVIVKDGTGKPIGNARVRLSTGASAPVEVTTRSDGRAVFMLSLDQFPTGQTLLATVIGPNGGNPVTDTISVSADRWEITMPGVQAHLPRCLDLAIVLDTTGSMTDEITHLKAEIRGISAAIAKQFPEVKQRFALICYRDEGDAYVTKVFDFTPSLDFFHKNLSAQSAAGGGDYPEAMHRGLEESLQLRWQDKDTARVVFLIADAPPHAQHMDRTLTAVNTLRKKGVAVYPVACSGYDDACEFVMRSSAMLTGSQFLFLTDDSGVGNAHAEPRIPYYQVERLERLMIRMIGSELSGQRLHPVAADIIRTVGKKVN